MRDSKNRDRIRYLLLMSEDGMTVSELKDHIGTTEDNIRKMLSKMYGCYIARWQTPRVEHLGGSLAAVWKSVEVPPHAPDPSGRVEILKHIAKNRKPVAKKTPRPLPQPVAANEPYKPSGLTKWASPPPWATKER